MTHPSRMPRPVAGTDSRQPLREALFVASLLVALIALTGCAAADENAAGELKPSTSTTTPSGTESTGSDHDDWPEVDETGTGPATLTILRPSPEAFYLDANFSCTTGESMVELQEDPRVFMSGSCGGAAGYQMPLPADVTELHFIIKVDEGSDFTFTGTFLPQS